MKEDVYVKNFNRTITIIVFIFLYFPILILMVASFSSGTDIAVFKEFTFNQYAEFFKDHALMDLVWNSFLVAIVSTVVATVLGTLAAFGIYSMRGRMRSFVMTTTDIPITNPDIVTGVSLALLFAFAGGMLRINGILSFWTILIAHITFNLPYVILNVMPRLHRMNPHLTEAAMDLGCTQVQAFFKVTIHEIMPGIISGALMAFTMSLDDFVISYFVTGSSFITLPVEIYNFTKKPLHPKLYALFTLLFVVILLLMIVMNVLQSRADKSGRIKLQKDS